MEPKSERRLLSLHPIEVYCKRILRGVAVAVLIVSGSLGIGTCGYHLLEGLPWIDAIYNASMILTGMGPVDTLRTTAGKLFASGYALFSGVVFLTTSAILFAPVLQRFLHRFHLEITDEEGTRPKE